MKASLRVLREAMCPPEEYRSGAAWTLLAGAAGIIDAVESASRFFREGRPAIPFYNTVGVKPDSSICWPLAIRPHS